MDTTSLTKQDDLEPLQSLPNIQLKPTLEKPSQIIKNIVNKVEKEITIKVAKQLEITGPEAWSLLKDNSAFEDLIELIIKGARLDILLNTIPKILEAAEKKIESGSLEQLKHAITAFAIGFDKGRNSDQTKSNLAILGKNISVNVGFGFKAYQKK